jgi:hypothetical protein
MIEERSYFWMGYVILAIVIFIPIILVMQKTSQGNSFNEQLISNDLALLGDMAMGVNGDVEIIYNMNNNLDDFYSIGFSEDCEINVAYKDTSILSSSRSTCGDNLNLEKTPLDFFEYSSIIIEKKGNKFLVSEKI